MINESKIQLEITIQLTGNDSSITLRLPHGRLFSTSGQGNLNLQRNQLMVVYTRKRTRGDCHEV